MFDPKWLAIVKAVLPMALAASGNEKAAKISGLVVEGIDRAEAMVGAKGTDKLQYALSLVDLGLVGHNIARPEHPIHLEEVHESVANGISTAIAIANLIKVSKPVQVPVPTGPGLPVK